MTAAPLGDVLGSYREVTAGKRAAALASIDPSHPVATFSLGGTFCEELPAWGARSYRQQLAIMGWDPGPEFRGEVIDPDPRGPNRMTALEERVQLSFNMGSKLNGLAHAGIGDEYYGGRHLHHLVSDGGVTELDTTTWGPPLLTRGLLVDLVAVADASMLVAAPDGRPMLDPDRVVTRADIELALHRQGLPHPEPGDAVLFRTGWSHLVRDDPARFLAGSPGVWLEETRWIASWRPALVATDSWCWGTSNPEVVLGSYGACHQELLVHHGIRFGEGWQFDELVDAGVDRFVLCHNPIRAVGAVSTISPAMAIANVR